MRPHCIKVEVVNRITMKHKTSVDGHMATLLIDSQVRSFIHLIIPGINDIDTSLLVSNSHSCNKSYLHRICLSKTTHEKTSSADHRTRSPLDLTWLPRLQRTLSARHVSVNRLSCMTPTQKYSHPHGQGPRCTIIQHVFA
jgi:hypothetical protein